MGKNKVIGFVIVLIVVLQFVSDSNIINATPLIPNIDISIGGDGEQSSSMIQVLYLFIILALLPTILLMMTGFTRIIIVLHFLRSALGTQQMPPNQVMIGIALILTLFTMSGTLDTIYNEAYEPLQSGAITSEEFVDRSMNALRAYMLKEVKKDDIDLFYRLANETPTPVLEDVPSTVLIPAYILGELKTGFESGFMLYIPYIIIDMVVASVLMAMGMMMLPPAMISLPFKIIIFLLSGGWSSAIVAVMGTFK